MRSDHDEVRLITFSDLEYGPSGRIAAHLSSYIPTRKVRLNSLCTLVRENLCLIDNPFRAFFSMSLNLGDANHRHVIGWQLIVWRRQDDVGHSDDERFDGWGQSGASEIFKGRIGAA